MTLLRRIAPLALIAFLGGAMAAAYFFVEREQAAEYAGSSVEVGFSSASPFGKGSAVPASGSSSTYTNSCGSETPAGVASSIVCSGGGGSYSAPPSIKLHISPAEISQGQPSTLSWTWSFGSEASGISSVRIERCAAADVISVPVTTRDAYGGTSIVGYSTDCRAWSNVTTISGTSFAPAESRQSCDMYGCSSYTYQNPNGTSPSYDAQSQTLAGGNYIYRATGSFNSGEQTDMVLQKVRAMDAPDLQGLIGDHGTFYVNVPQPISYGIANQGALPAAAGAGIELRFDSGRNGFTDGTGGDFAVSVPAAPALAASGDYQHAEREVSFSSTGEWRVCVAVDTGNAIQEGDETNNSTACDDFIVQVQPISATLEARSASAGIDWTSAATLNIVTGNPIELRWSSNGAGSCQGTNFVTGGATSGGTTPSTQPAGDTLVYRLECTASGLAPAWDWIAITAENIAPTLTAEEETVRMNDPINFSWNLNGNNASLCTLTGPGSTLAAPGSITAQTGSVSWNALGTATYTLSCPGGEDSVEINVLPQFFES